MTEANNQPNPDSESKPDIVINANDPVEFAAQVRARIELGFSYIIQEKAALDQAEAERAKRKANISNEIKILRALGISWRKIGDEIGMSAQLVNFHYGRETEDQSKSDSE